MIEGLLGRKLGMVQIFDKQGRMRGVTVIETGPCLVTQIKTVDTDGYQAVQVGFGSARRTNKPMRGHLNRLGDLRYLREVRVEDPGQHKVGERVGAELFQEGDRVDITGISKGRGFAGSVKRHGFAGGPRTHGQSDRHRAPGSIGAGNAPGRVFRGQRMATHMGAEQVTVRNLEVLQSNAARGILLVAGAAPGARNGLLKIRYSKRTLEAARTRTPKEAEPKAAASDEEPREDAAEEQEAPLAVTGQQPSEASAAEEAQQPEEGSAAEESTPAEGEGPSGDETT